MTTQAPLDPKVQNGIKQLDELMIAGGVTITAAVFGRPQTPEPLDGVVPDIYGTDGQVPAIGKVVPVEVITKDTVKHDLHKLTDWARQHKAALYLAVIGKPGKGFHGFEQGLVIDEFRKAGWELIQL